MIPGYEQGSDITILNTIYHYPRKNESTGRWDSGAITIVAKDNVNNKKVMTEIENPTYVYYMAKEGKSQEHNRLFIKKEDAERIEVPYIELEKDIAERTGNLNFYFDNIKNGNRRENRILHEHVDVFNSDTHIEDHIRFRFSQMYQNRNVPVTKAYFDIEADVIDIVGDFPEPGEAPINAITLIDDARNEIHTLLLRNDKNPLIKEFEQSVNGTFFKELQELINKTVGGYKQAKRLGVSDYKFNMYFYNEQDEIKLIQDLFIMINTIKPDFVLAWNMAFDMPYIIARIKKLGYNPVDIICHPDFDRKVCEYFVDELHKNEFAERGDFCKVSSYSVYLDQMIQFASRRKGQSAFTSFSLNYIGGVIAGAKKLDYSHITTELAKLPYLDYKTFVMYNIVDTIVQKCIEVKAGDIDYVFNKCITNCTRYAKCHRQTVYLANRGMIEFYEQGYIIGNNTNRGNPKPTEKYPGAFVADPLNISDIPKMKINGVPVMLFDNLDDFDYARLYPSILQEFNIAPNTQIGKVIFPQKVYEGENRRKDEKYSREGQFMEDLQSHVYLEFAERWLHLGGYEDLYDDIIEYFNTVANSCRTPKFFNEDGSFCPIRKINPELGGIKPISIEKTRRPIISYKTPLIKEVMEVFYNDEN